MKLEIIEENPFKLENVSVRLVRDTPLYSDTVIDTPRAAVELIGKSLSELDREVICVVNCAADGKPINVNFASVGALNSAIASPRELLKTSILSNAAKMLLIHNHPSGNVQPSEEDRHMTDRMIQICEMVGIPLIDHIIVAGRNQNKYFSFMKNNLMENNALTGIVAEKAGKTDMAVQLARRVEDRIISIHRDTMCYDYIVYNTDYVDIRNGTYDTLYLNIEEIFDKIHNDMISNGEIQKDSEVYSLSATEVDEKAEKAIQNRMKENIAIYNYRNETEKIFSRINGKSAAELEDEVKAKIKDIINDNHMDVQVNEVILYGSRSRGLENGNSDIDFMLTYTGTVNDVVLFNVIAEKGIAIDGTDIKVDVNTFHENYMLDNARGTVEVYLEEAEKYLLAKRIDTFLYEYDPYSYFDATEVNSREQNVSEIFDAIIKGDTASFKNTFMGIVEEYESSAGEHPEEIDIRMLSDATKAREIINELKKINHNGGRSTMEQEMEKTKFLSVSVSAENVRFFKSNDGQALASINAGEGYHYIRKAEQLRTKSEDDIKGEKKYYFSLPADGSYKVTLKRSVSDAEVYGGYREENLNLSAEDLKKRQEDFEVKSQYVVISVSKKRVVSEFEKNGKSLSKILAPGGVSFIRPTESLKPDPFNENNYIFSLHKDMSVKIQWNTDKVVGRTEADKPIYESASREVSPQELKKLYDSEKKYRKEESKEVERPEQSQKNKRRL